MRLLKGLVLLLIILLGKVSSSQSFEHLRIKEEFDLENPSQVNGYGAVNYQNPVDAELCDAGSDESLAADACSDPDACW